MNYLAHLYLAGDDPDLIVGNFIADAVKGKQIERFSEGVVRGIKLHRQIDLFTDTHPIIERGKEALRPKYRKFAGIVMDVFGDHFLSSNWSDYSKTDLRDFTERVYTLLHERKDQFPEKARYTLHYMSMQDWLQGYQHIEGVKRALSGLARRSTFPSGMENAHKELERHYLFYQSIFHEFLPDLVRFIDKDREINLRDLLLG
ncbi:MAG TPA: ACP phosphodiesterase [Flavobacteriales bacterium]|jgi:acyl carrier protein phosphodiesterase|nr:ACP phosphodiesterase [Flavobacteriales bacterium]